MRDENDLPAPIEWAFTILAALPLLLWYGLLAVIGLAALRFLL